METRSRKGNNTNLDSSSNILTKTVPVQTEMPRAHVIQSTDRESERYLEQLLRVYEDQVLMLKCELGKKNETISDLMKIINSFHEDKICNKKDLPARENPLEHGVSEQLSQATQNCHDNSTTIENQNAWQLPKNPVQSINHNSEMPLETSNRYDLLENQWLNFDDSTCDHIEDSITEEREKSPTQTKRRRRGKRRVTILGDSMVKDIKQWELQRSLPNHKLFSKTFPGATTKDMGHYVKPSLTHEPDLLFLHTGTNDLRSNSSPHDIATSIMELASSMKTEENAVVVSSLIKRGDSLNEKASTVNMHLSRMCMESNIDYLDNSNTLLEQLQGEGIGGVEFI